MHEGKGSIVHSRYDIWTRVAETAGFVVRLLIFPSFCPLHLFHCVLSESSFHYQAPPGVKNMSLFSFSLWIGLNALVVAYIILEAHALSHLPESCFFMYENRVVSS